MPGVFRRTLGVLSLVAAVTLVVGLSVQISDQIINDAFYPEEYFSYFTIQTSLANVVALTVAGLYQLQSARDHLGVLLAKKFLFAYAIVTGVVYNLLLRGLPTEPGEFVSDITFPNEILHVVIPAYIALDWLITPHRRRLPVWSLFAGLAYPIGWLAFTLIRGDLTGWYPYDFLDPSGDAGWPGVFTHVAGIALFIFALLGLALIINRLYSRMFFREAK
jgi:hypothetical protein